MFSVQYNCVVNLYYQFYPVSAVYKQEKETQEIPYLVMIRLCISTSVHDRAASQKQNLTKLKNLIL